jgi:hypothetical protein
VSGLLLDGPNTSSGTESAFNLGNGDDGFVVHRVGVVEASGGTVTVSGGSGTVASRLAVWGSSLEMSANGDETGSNMFWSGHSFAIMNTLIDNHLQAEFNIRFVGGRNIILTDSEWRRPGFDSGRNAIQIRGTDPQTTQNGRAVIRRNLFVSHGHSAAPFLRFCRDAGCHDDGPAGGATMQDILVESNHMHFDRGVTTTPNYGLVSIRAGEVTVRNNTIDLSGLGSNGGNIRMCYVIDEPRGGGSYDNVHCFNNTIYSGDQSNEGLILCEANVGAGHRCYNNLVYTPNLTGSFDESSGSWQVGGNLRASASPFAAGSQPGVPFATSGAEFVLAPTDTLATDRGVSIAGTFANSIHHDWAGRCRAEPIDIGAFERATNPVGCPEEGPIPAPSQQNSPPAAPLLFP